MPETWSVCVANALLCAAYGMMWGGARSFEGRRVRIPLLAAGAAIWIVAFQFESFAQSMQARISLVSVDHAQSTRSLRRASYGTRATAI